ncbi:hypothetical protein I8748_34305 [Nostoc sp. CENA67]|uniref:Uncharacterized protein n=1 Tax=Amazonocrinis nigriterrae CENA67 TaxID=2794033 RepID=A0A8J7HZK9_9NOST|nr:hypothetical protein [Amazonocrinis nigriterrae]MBH8567165.1 hypothetical protein [Amazonocrinis nigriterrae CENA67]
MSDLLKLKLASNHQRLLRQEYLAAVPDCLGIYLERCLYVQSPKRDEIVWMFYIEPNGIVRELTEDGKFDYHVPEGYSYQEFSWTEQLIEAAISVGDKHDQEEAFLYPFADSPLYQVPFGWVRQHLYELFQCKWKTNSFNPKVKHNPKSVGVVAANFNAGIVINNYSGYLEVDPNPDEVVYQLAVWGF